MTHDVNTLTLIKPDDWHCHLRDGPYLSRTVPDIARQFSRAIVMPNLNPPVTDIIAVEQYHARIMQAVPPGLQFTPLMTLYLTDNFAPAIIAQAKTCPLIYAAKLYPAGATTHSRAGVRDLKSLYPALETMQRLAIPLLIHGEIADPTLDIFERESNFIDHQLTPIVNDFPELKIVFEHISSKHAVDFVLAASPYVAATITAHHLLLNRNAILTDGIHPHHYCLPVVKTAADQQALIAAATSGHAKFFLGTDSAPHAVGRKHCATGAAGIYTGYAAIELYAQLFAQHDALDQLEAFASRNGPRFYQLPTNTETIELINKTWTVPNSLPFGDSEVIPLLAGETLSWQRA